MKQSYFFASVLLAAGSVFCASAAEATPQPLTGAVRKAAEFRIDESQWKHLGTGKFSDPVLCNEMRGYYSDPVDVEVYESIAEPGVYRVENPWPAVTENPQYNFMVIDTTDPEYVRVREGVLPVETAEDGFAHFQSMTEWLWHALGDDLESAKDRMNLVMPNLIPTFKDGYVDFPRNCCAVMYPDGANEEPGRWMPTNGAYSGYLALPEAEVQDGWMLRGTGKIFDGFLAPIFGDEPEERDVIVYENEDYPDVFKIENAIKVKEGEFAPIFVDAVDHDYVIIPEVDTRIVTEAFGPLSILSVSSQYESYESMIAALPDADEKNITYKDGVIDMPAMSVCLFFPSYNNTEYTNHVKQMRSYIIIPEAGSGVSTEEISEEAAPEYFDLQGIRLSEPVKGQLTIVRRGGKVSKTIIK